MSLYNKEKIRELGLHDPTVQHFLTSRRKTDEDWTDMLERLVLVLAEQNKNLLADKLKAVRNNKESQGD